jgi:hypothetical protein
MNFFWRAQHGFMSITESCKQGGVIPALWLTFAFHPFYFSSWTCQPPSRELVLLGGLQGGVDGQVQLGRQLETSEGGGDFV